MAMKIFICGGGTGGHINPALAVAQKIREEIDGAEITFGGAQNGMEEKLVPAAGFPLKTVDCSGFKRSLSPKAVLFNANAARRMLLTRKKAEEIVREASPKLLFATGGYASYPYVRAAHKMGIPVVLHESNALPGKAVKLTGRYAEKILLGFPEAVPRLPENLRGKTFVTGNPLRKEMTGISKEEIRRKLGITGPLVISFWGSLGAREMNRVMTDFILLSSRDGSPFTHIHATGKYGWQWVPDMMREKGINKQNAPKTDVREYIHNMPELLNAADLVICRAGAMTMTEIAATGTPAIIVPSPNVAENHQEINALAMQSRGGAIMIREKEATGERLYNLTRELLSDPERLAKMSHAISENAITDATDRIYQELKLYL